MLNIYGGPTIRLRLSHGEKIIAGRFERQGADVRLY
jgi:hypothetical protein